MFAWCWAMVQAGSLAPLHLPSLLFPSTHLPLCLWFWVDWTGTGMRRSMLEGNASSSTSERLAPGRPFVSFTISDVTYGDMLHEVYHMTHRLEVRHLRPSQRS